jgi:hypothetical protein
MPLAGAQRARYLAARDGPEAQLELAGNEMATLE